MIKNEYNEKGAQPGPHQVVEFESDMITLDIPMEGITKDGWKITPLMRPVVSSCVHVSTQYINQHSSLATTSGDQETGGQL